VQPALRNVEFYLKKGNNIKYEFVNVQRIQFKHSGGDFFMQKRMINLLIHIARSNEILGWEGVGNPQLLCFFKA
jgi:hypothetical protein